MYVLLLNWVTYKELGDRGWPVWLNFGINLLWL